MGAALMAKGKAKAAREGARKGDAPPRALVVRTSAAWADWVERGAEHCRTDMSKLVDIAIVTYLKAQGFDEPPPKR